MAWRRHGDVGRTTPSQPAGLCQQLLFYNSHATLVSPNHIHPISLHAFLHVHIKTVLLNKWCFTLLTFLGLLAPVYSVDDFQLVGQVKGLFALTTLLNEFSCEFRRILNCKKPLGKACTGIVCFSNAYNPCAD